MVCQDSTAQRGQYFKLIQDNSENFPSFENIMYCALDYQMVLINILWFYLFDYYTKNPLLSICLTYIIECIFREVRSTVGASNLSKKTMVESAFLI